MIRPHWAQIRKRIGLTGIEPQRMRLFLSRRDDRSLDLLAAFVSRSEMPVGSLIGYNSTLPEKIQTLSTHREDCD